MSDGRPQHWVETTLEEIALWGSGGTPSRSNGAYYGGDIPWIKTGELGPKYLKQTEESLTVAGIENSSAKIFPKGSIAIAMYGATIGKTSILGIDAATNQACAVARPKADVVDTEFLYYLLRSLKDDLVAAGQGGAQPNISQTVLKRWPIRLPPLAEQKRIADKLERLLAAVDTCKACLDAIPDILKRFRQSVLAAAVSGELTEEWRRERAVVRAQRLGLPTHWKMLNVADVCEAIVDCPHSTPKWTHTGRICVRTTDFRAGLLDLSSAKYVSEETYKERTRRIEPRKGDVLYSREGTVGVACPVPPGVSICLGQRILLLRPSTLIHSEYLVHVLNSPATMRIVSQLTIGSTAPRVNVSNVKSFPLALPPLDEQGEIVRRIGSLFATADLVERALAAACLGTEALARSVLEKAFRGETVPSSSNSDLAILTGEITDLSRDTSPADSDHSSSSRKRRASVG